MIGPAHHIRELQATRGPLPLIGADKPINILVNEFNAAATAYNATLGSEKGTAEVPWKEIVSEVTSVLEGYSGSHTTDDSRFRDAMEWQRHAQVLLDAQAFGVLRAFSPQTLRAIASGHLDVAAIYDDIRGKRPAQDEAT